MKIVPRGEETAFYERSAVSRNQAWLSLISLVCNRTEEKDIRRAIPVILDACSQI